MTNQLTGNFIATDQGLSVGGFAIAELCAANQDRGPFYLYDGAWVDAQYEALDKAFKATYPHGHQIRYAVKANDALAILKRLAAAGAGADIVSGGELDRALAAGIPANKIVFAGVGKTEAEIEKALSAGIQQFNVESLPELERIDAVAQRLGMVAPVALRTNPDVDAKTHAKITTGTKANKFGIALDDIPGAAQRIQSMAGVRLVAIAMHIGSQITTITPYEQAYDVMAALVQSLMNNGIKLERIDVGGGMGVDYGQGEQGIPFTAFATAVSERLAPLGLPVLIEPGRSIVAEAGVLLTQVQYVKESYDRRFAIVDAGMHTLMRPALYDAVHPVVAVRNPDTADLVATDLVGPICESTDVFAKQIDLPRDLKQGDWIALMSAGAYGHVMANQYNGHALPPLWLAENGVARNIRPALGDTLLAQELALG